MNGRVVAQLLMLPLASSTTLARWRWSIESLSDEFKVNRRRSPLLVDVYSSGPDQNKHRYLWLLEIELGASW